VGVGVLHSLRQALDGRLATRLRQLLATGDGSYTNRTMLRQLPERTTFIGRIRKDAKLFWALLPAGATRSGGRPRHYGALAPTPEQVLHDESVPVVKVRCFAAGEVREIPTKVLSTVFWRTAGADMPSLLAKLEHVRYPWFGLFSQTKARLRLRFPFWGMETEVSAATDGWRVV